MCCFIQLQVAKKALSVLSILNFLFMFLSLISMTCRVFETAFLDFFSSFSCNPMPSSGCSVLHKVNPS